MLLQGSAVACYPSSYPVDVLRVFMAKHKLTDRWIQAASPALAGRLEIGDLLCPGLYLRITVGGAKTWSVVMRVRDQVQRVTLGRYPVVTLASARKQAMQLLREVSEGGDPRADAEAARLAAEQAAADTSKSFGALVDAYEMHIKANARSWQMIVNSLRRVEVLPLHGKPADAVTRRELMEAVDGLAAAGKPHAAGNLLRHLKMALSWAVGRGLLPASPLDKARAPVRANERDRVLSDTEIAAAWRACESLPQPWRAMIRMLILTGQRRTEVSAMRWEEVDLATALWTIPRERVKKDRPHVVPLSPAAVAILAEIGGDDASGFVFSTTGGTTASSNFNKTKAKLDAACGFGDWVLHDLRRTVRSGLAALGVPREVARAVVNHADGKIDRVYNRYDYATEKREALERWERHLLSVVQIHDSGLR